MSFSSLGLSPLLVRAVAEKGYVAPTSIQTTAIPIILAGHDLRASAQTGSGKTGAFALPILHSVLQRRRESQRSVFALVLVPTRELAMQISESFRSYAKYSDSPLHVVTAFGGVSINPQMMALRGGADIVVATPGRLLDLVDHNALKLGSIATLVLDEADKLFELGFADELTRILMLLPPRQTLLFSATFPPMVQTLASIVLAEPKCIDIEAAQSSPNSIVQRALSVDAARRTQLVRELIRQHGWTRVLVFVATKYATEHVAEKLRRGGVVAASLHGELSQGARSQALADFKASKVHVLVATDLAARGIDIANLPVVVNYDLPRSAVDYTHRIGRTGRAGQSGIAVSFITPESESHFRLIEKRNGIELQREEIPGFVPETKAISPVSPTDIVPSTGGIKGKRKSKKDKLREAAAKQRGIVNEPTKRS